MPSEYVKDLVDHKARAAAYLQSVACDLFRRAAVHDNSKYAPEEFEAYEEAFPELQQYAYGTDEFRAALRKIKPAIAHHYQANDHHPEHFEGGANDMNLIQLLEMLCDWLAASERSQTDFSHGLEMNKERFALSDQLFAILKNTVRTYAPHRLSPDPRTLYPDVLLTEKE